MPAVTNFVALVGRLMLAYIFVESGIHKLGAIAGTVANMASHGVPAPDVLVWGAVVLEIGGGLLLATGLLARWAALALGAYTLALALIFHAYWLVPAAEARSQYSIFFEHIAIVGGMLYVVAFGAGCFSLDAALWRRAPSP
jgi:putative oxidoreductase